VVEILEFLLQYFKFLLLSERFHIVDSVVFGSFGGDAQLTITSEVIKMRFMRDRSQLFLDFQSTEQKTERNWFSIDIVARLLGKNRDTSVLDEEWAEFVRDHLDDIEVLFSPDSLPMSVTAFHQYERERARKMFD
jgi:hypothetical protein